MRLGSVCVSLAAFIAMFGSATLVHAAPGACAVAARAELAATCGSYETSRLTLDLRNDGDSIARTVTCPKFRPGSSDERQVVLLAPGQENVPMAPEGYRLDDLTTEPEPLLHPSCAGVGYVVFVKEQASDAREPAAARDTEQTALLDALYPPSLSAANLNDAPNSAVPALRAIKAYGERLASDAHGGVPGAIAGTSHGAFDGALSDALQIVGQIVVDRASSHAYALIKQKLETLLGCSDEAASSKGFGATCRVVVPLRVEELAVSRDALVTALARDALSQIHVKLGDDKPLVAPSVALNSVLATVLLPRVTRPGGVSDDTLAKQLLDALVTYARMEIEEGTLDGRPAQKVNVVATLAYLRCATPVDSNAGEDVNKRLAACDVGANVDALVGNDTKILAASHALANALVATATATPKGGDIRIRLVHAVDTVFANSCMLLREQTAMSANAEQLPTPELTCKEPKTLAHPEDALSLMHPIVVSLVYRDTNSLIASIVHALRLVTAKKGATRANTQRKPKEADKEAESRTRERTQLFALLGGLLNYAKTYVPRPSGDTDTTDEASLHEQRTSTLESLTRTMTDRTRRDSDCVWSLGGALQVVGAARLPLEKQEDVVAHGPISLPLGLGMQTVGGGVHFMASVVDLGQYVAWDSSLEVAKPNVVAALSPSLSFGYAWGTSFPVVVAATAGYSPHYHFSDSSSKGSLNVGVTLGVYVPLIDLN